MLAYLVAVAIIFGIYALLTLSLDLHYGFTGLINFGHVGFFAIGAYAAAICSLDGLPYVVGFTAAAGLAAAAACPLGLLALRLREDYLAIVTLAFSEIVRIVITAEEWLTRGVQGLPAIPRPFAEYGIGRNAEFAYLGLVAAMVLATVVLIRHLVRSPFGRLIQAIRDDEVAAMALGKSPAIAKVQVFMIGAAIAGIAGALYAHYMSYIVPDQFMPLVTFYVWMAMILGGAGRIGGALLGTAILIAILEGSRVIRDVFPGVLQVEMASLRLALVGILLVVFVLYRPQGLLAKHPES
jgi:branched-chain amino acid transport system permease protein